MRTIHDFLARLRTAGRSAGVVRLRARLPRFAFLAVSLVLCVAGLRSILAPGGAAAPVTVRQDGSDRAVESFATQFARAYLTYEQGGASAYESALARFAGGGSQLVGSFSPPRNGTRHVLWAEVAQVQEALAGEVVVTVAAATDVDPQPLYLSVPVRRGSGGAIFLAGYPAFVGPPLTSAASLSVAVSQEAVSEEELARLVERALRNYLAGDAENLAADLAKAATVTLPTTRLILSSVQDLSWIKGEGSGAVLATLGARDGRGGEYTLRYEVGVRRVLAADPRIAPPWRVTYVQAISQEP